MSKRKAPPPPPDPARVAGYRTPPEFVPLQLGKLPHLRQSLGAFAITRPLGVEAVCRAPRATDTLAPRLQTAQTQSLATQPEKQEIKMPTSSVKTRTGIASKIREYLQEHGDASAPEMGKAFGFPTYEFTKVNNALNSLERIKDGNPRIVRRENRDALGRIVWGLEWNDAPPADGADPAKAQPTADASVDLDGRTLADCVKRFAFPIQASGDHFISAPKTDTGVRFWLSDKGELQIERGASDFRFDVATTKRLYKLLVGCVVLEEA